MSESSAGERLVLLVENNQDDIMLIRRTFERSGFRHRILSVTSGMDAIAYFLGDTPYHDRQKYALPNLVLLDIKMPGTDGFDVLRFIRRQTELVNLPVVMLTSSDEIRDVNQAYRLGANSFLVKPLDFANAIELGRTLDRVLQQAES